MKNNSSWQKVKLGDLLLKIFSGGTPDTRVPEYWNGDLPWLSSGETRSNYIDGTEKKISKKAVDESSTRWANKNDVIIATAGQGSTRGQIAYLNIDTYINQSIIAMHTDDKLLNSKFLFLNLRNRYRELRSLSDSTSSRGSITIPLLKEMEITIPNLDSQSHIASILSAFDDKIELNNKINANLEKMAQEIFKEWFVKQNNKWHEGKINDIIKIISGYPFSSKLFTISKDALGIVTIRNVQDANFVTDCESSIIRTNIPNNMSPECFIKDSDIILSLTGNVGRICYVYGGEYLLNQRVAKIKPHNPNDIAFSYFMFRQKSMQNHLINLAKGSAQPNLSPVETGEIVVKIPPREILDKFNKIANPIYSKLVKNSLENNKLSVLRDLLLPKLMKGEVRV